MADETELLAAIYAAPDDDGPRAVYADWLSERGDPRGEFIALQLAHHPSAKAARREAELLRKHRRAWAGRLETVLGPCVFVRGFPCRGVLVRDRADAIRGARAWPEWQLFDALDLAAVGADVLAALAEAPWFRRLRVLEGLDPTKLDALASLGALPDVARISFRAGASTPRFGALFPRLERLDVQATPELFPRLFAHPLPATLAEVTVTCADAPLDALRRAAEDAGVRVPRLAVRTSKPGSDESYALRRDADGHYARLLARPDSPRVLDALVRSLPRLTELVVEPDEVWSFGDGQIVEAGIATRSDLASVVAPWSRRRPGMPREEVGPTLELYLWEVDALTHAETLLAAIQGEPFRAAFDVAAADRGRRVAFTGDPGPLVRRLAEDAAAVRLHHTASPSARRASFNATFFTAALPRVPADAVAAWLVRLLDAVHVGHFAVPFLTVTETGLVEARGGRALLPFGGALDCIRGYGPNDERLFSFDELLGAARAIPGVRGYRTRRNVFFVCDDDVGAEAPPSVADAFERVMVDAFWRHFERTRGFHPGRLADEVLAPALAAFGYTPRAIAPVETAMGNRQWTSATPPYTVSLRIEVLTISAEVQIGLWIETGDPDGPTRVPGTEAMTVPTSDAAVAALRTLAAALPVGLRR